MDAKINSSGSIAELKHIVKLSYQRFRATDQSPLLTPEVSKL